MREKECHGMKEWKEELRIGTTEEIIKKKKVIKISTPDMCECINKRHKKECRHLYVML